MKLSNDINPLSLKSKEIEKTKKIIMKTVIIITSIFFLSMGKIFGVIGGLGFGAIVALPFNYSLLGLLASVVAYGINGFNFHSLAYTVAALIVILVKYIAVINKKKLYQPLILSCITLVSTLIISVVCFFYLDLPLSLFGIEIMQSLFATTITYYSFSFYRVLISDKTFDKYAKYEIYSCIVMAALIVCVFCSTEIFGINIGFLLATMFIILASTKFGCIGGGICGIVALIALSLNSVAYIEFSAVLILAGFFGGIFYDFGKIAVMSSFIFSYAVIFILFASPGYNLIGATSVLLGTAVTFFFPSRYLDLINVSVNKKNIDTKLFKTNLSSKLTFVSASINDLQRSLNFVGNKMAVKENNINSICETIENSLCAKCSGKLNCYDLEYNSIKKGMAKSINILKKQGNIDRVTLPDELNENCINIQGLINSINQAYNSYLDESQKNSTTYNARMLVNEQLSCITDVLGDLCDELSDLQSLDVDLSKKVESALNNNNMPINQISCYIDKNNKFSVDLYMYSDAVINYKLLGNILEQISQKELDSPVVINIKPYTRISYFEKGEIYTEFGARQLNFKKCKVSGDSYDDFIDCKGNHFLMLSDGMGKGRRAALDSVMTCSIMQELTRAGFGYESALKLLNSALSVKSSDESIATIDIVKLDPFKKVAEFIKAGAASSYLYQDGEVQKIQAFTLPIGILQGIEYDKKVTNINKGDIIILVSDGVINISDDLMKHILATNYIKSAGEIANVICDTAKVKGINEQDDITVLVWKIL